MTSLYKVFDIDYYAILMGFCEGMLATPDNSLNKTSKEPLLNCQQGRM